MNTQVIEGSGLAAAEALPAAAGLPALERGLLQRHGAEGHVVALAGGQVAARASWWLRTAPPAAGETVAVLGHFDAIAAEPAQAVLETAVTALRARGATLVVGPMDGNTWRRYRWVVDRGDEPPFLMEPWNPPGYPEWWRAAGFEPLAHYQSALVTDLQARDPRMARVRERMEATGLRVRNLDPSRFVEDLRTIHEVSLAGFAQAFLYTPMDAEDFVAQYLAWRDKVRPEFVFLAEEMTGLRPRCIGFIFAIPDYLRTQRSGALDTLILKTIAVLPGRTSAGLGTFLIETAHEAAAAAGFTRAIHALSNQGNPVVNITARYGRIMRRYALFARRTQA